MSFRPEDVMRRRTGLFLQDEPDPDPVKSIIDSLDFAEIEVRRGE
ncbi:MAG: hypothetical protein ACLFN7_04400 [Candidatus Acetothermia bacterium]